MARIQERIFARQIRGAWMRIRQYRDAAGQRHQQSLGAISAEDARELNRDGGMMTYDAEPEGQGQPDVQSEDDQSREWFDRRRSSVKDMEKGVCDYLGWGDGVPSGAEIVSTLTDAVNRVEMAATYLAEHVHTRESDRFAAGTGRVSVAVRDYAGLVGKLFPEAGDDGASG